LQASARAVARLVVAGARFSRWLVILLSMLALGCEEFDSFLTDSASMLDPSPPDASTPDAAEPDAEHPNLTVR
jgi:hypothetical protein